MFVLYVAHVFVYVEDTWVLGTLGFVSNSAEVKIHTSHYYTPLDTLLTIVCSTQELSYRIILLLRVAHHRSGLSPRRRLCVPRAPQGAVSKH